MKYLYCLVTMLALAGLTGCKEEPTGPDPVPTNLNVTDGTPMTMPTGEGETTEGETTEGEGAAEAPADGTTGGAAEAPAEGAAEAPAEGDGN